MHSPGMLPLVPHKIIIKPGSFIWCLVQPPPPPPKSAAEFGQLRRSGPPICWVSEFRRFVLLLGWISGILPIRSADLLDPGTLDSEASL